MKKINWLLTALAVIASAFLLWLWYFLGFNKVDDPFDLALSIGWWCLILAVLIGITYTERKRQERIRTAYLGNGVLFNPEAGLVNTVESPSQVDALQDVLANLEYGFGMKDLPDPQVLPLDYIVHTSKFKMNSDENSQPTWEGDITFVRSSDQEPKPFSSKAELASILAFTNAAA